MTAEGSKGGGGGRWRALSLVCVQYLVAHSAVAFSFSVHHSLLTITPRELKTTDFGVRLSRRVQRFLS